MLALVITLGIVSHIGLLLSVFHIMRLLNHPLVKAGLATVEPSWKPII